MSSSGFGIISGPEFRAVTYVSQGDLKISRWPSGLDPVPPVLKPGPGNGILSTATLLFKQCFIKIKKKKIILKL